MKKTIQKMTVIVMLMTMLIGCGKIASDEKQETINVNHQYQDEVSILQNMAGTLMNVDSDYDFEKTTYYVIDDHDQVLYEYTYEDAVDILCRKEGLPTIWKKEGFFSAVYGTKAFLVTVLEDSNSNLISKLYEIDVYSDSCILLDDLGTDYCDVYMTDGILYEVKYGIDDEQVITYEYDEESNHFVKAEFSKEEALSLDYNLADFDRETNESIMFHEYSVNFSDEFLYRSFEAYGFALVYSEEKGYRLLETDGTSSHMDSLDGIKPYDVKILQCGSFFYGTEDGDAYLYDVKNKKTIALDFSYYSVGISGSDESGFYYCDREHIDNQFEKSAFYYYDLETNQAKKVYEYQTKPGLREAYKADEFICINNEAYVTGINEDHYEWVKLSHKDDQIEADFIGIEMETPSYLNYGHVEIIESDNHSDFYYEYLVLDDNATILGSDKINVFFKEQYEMLEKQGLDSLDNGTNQEESTIPKYAYLKEAFLLDERYFVLNEKLVYADNNWEYIQHIFDCSTGEKVSLLDLYGGTKEELIQLMVDEAMADSDSYQPNANPYTNILPKNQGNLEDYIRETAFDTTRPILCEDGIHMVYGYYTYGKNKRLCYYSYYTWISYDEFGK